MTTAPSTPTHHATSSTPEPLFFGSSYPLSPSPIRRSDISIRIDPADNSRRNSDIEHDSIKFRSRFIERSREYDMELVRRQHAMIAVQPRTAMEEIEEKKRLLHIKVENRRRSEAAASKASNSLGTVTPNNRSPSPHKPNQLPHQQIIVSKPKPRGLPLKGPKNATEASKVSKKIPVSSKPTKEVTVTTKDIKK